MHQTEIQNRQLSFLVQISYDNARLQLAALTNKLLHEPPYCPDLAPSNYLRLLSFENSGLLDKDLNTMRNSRLPLSTVQTANFSVLGLKKRGERYEKCIELIGDQLEK